MFGRKKAKKENEGGGDVTNQKNSLTRECPGRVSESKTSFTRRKIEKAKARFIV